MLDERFEVRVQAGSELIVRFQVDKRFREFEGCGRGERPYRLGEWGAASCEH